MVDDEDTEHSMDETVGSTTTSTSQYIPSSRKVSSNSNDALEMMASGYSMTENILDAVMFEPVQDSHVHITQSVDTFGQIIMNSKKDMKKDNFQSSSIVSDKRSFDTTATHLPHNGSSSTLLPKKFGLLGFHQSHGLSTTTLMSQMMSWMVSTATSAGFEATVQTTKRVHKAIFGNRRRSRRDHHHQGSLESFSSQPNSTAPLSPDLKDSQILPVSEQLEHVERIVRELEVALRELDTLEQQQQSNGEESKEKYAYHIGQFFQAYESLVTTLESTLTVLQRWVPLPVKPTLVSSLMRVPLSMSTSFNQKYKLFGYQPSSKVASQQRLAQLCQDAAHLQEAIAQYKNRMMPQSDGIPGSTSIPPPAPPPPPPLPPNQHEVTVPWSQRKSSGESQIEHEHISSSIYEKPRFPSLNSVKLNPVTPTRRHESMDQITDSFPQIPKISLNQHSSHTMSSTKTPFSPDVLLQGRRSLRKMRRTPSGTPISERNSFSERKKQIVTTNDVVFEALRRKFEATKWGDDDEEDRLVDDDERREADLISPDVDTK